MNKIKKFDMFKYDLPMPIIDISQVAQAYKGKPHLCMCGCSGEYFHSKTNPDVVQRILNKVVRDNNDQNPVEVIIDGNKCIFTKVIGQTQYTIYTKEGTY